MLEIILNQIESLARSMPLELFVILGALIEEIIAPIPSPVVMVLAGSLAHTQNYNLWYLLELAALGALGKTFGSWLIYLLADKLEDIVVGRFGKFIGVTHKEIESIGKKLDGSWKDNFFLFLARALPIIPSAPVSIACGAIKLNLKTFITSTYLGNLVRNLLYLYMGYAGFENYKQITNGLDGLESIGQIGLLLAVVGLVVWAYWKRKKIK